MNSREKLLLGLLSAVILVGAVLNQVRRKRLADRRRASPVRTVVAHEADTSGLPLDLNTATARDLEALPGIGPVLARRVIDYRQRAGGFRSIAQLLEVSGIGPKRFAALKGLVCAGRQPAGRKPTAASE